MLDAKKRCVSAFAVARFDQLPGITISARIALLLMLGISTAGASERFDMKTWRRVKTHEMTALQKMEPLPLRRIVGVRFNYRSSDIRHLKPNWFYSSIWALTRTGDRADFSHIPVMVAKADLEAFKALPTNPHSGARYVVYGEVLEDMEARFPFLRLIGTKVKQERRAVRVRW